ncbi:MAG: pilE [Candidatus Berkelbacteria bacterium]|nr:pilE [Candidatus Berkelbacteria bacterium]
MKKRYCPPKGGFTLIELLIVIAIIAILAIIIVIAINPAKILEKSRDSQRFSDMTSLATAVNLYLADNQTLPATSSATTQDAGCLADLNACKKNDGTGWVPLNFSLVSSGAPLAALPLDPTNDATNYYRFGWNSTSKTYEIDCAFESTDNTAKHAADGGNNANRYEVGTDLTTLP